MSAERYVVIGLAHVRSDWFTEVARWSTAGSIPVEFVKCVSVEELRARVGGGRRFSAALLDGRLPAVDRDLLATLADSTIPSIVAEPVGAGPDWSSLGAASTLAHGFDRAALLDALVTHCQMVGVADEEVAAPGAVATASATWRGRLVAVTGRSGAGTSTVAAALAQGLAHDARYAGDVVLADFAHHAHQALLHDAQDVVPGLQELVEAHRSGRPTIEQLRRLTFDVPNRGYRLLLGLRRSRDWVTIRSRAFDAALDGLRRSARIVVADTDAEVEGETETGSFDIEDHNMLARTTLDQADLVVVVATPSISGIHGLITQLEDLRAHGVGDGRTLVVVNRAPRPGRARAELTRAIAVLTDAADRPDPHLGPVYVSDRRNVDHLHRDLSRFPAAMVAPTADAVRAVLDRLPARDLAARPVEAMAVVPGSLGHWRGDEEASS